MTAHNDEIISISSLESPEHAKYKDPKILTVHWMIGKRCNYDCSYCPSWLHDSFSSHLPIENIKKTIDNISQWAASNDKKFKIDFTGGEPFVHPNFVDALSHINKKNNVYTLGVVTNGSAKLDTYLTASKYLSNMTISLHPEESKDTVHDTIRKIIYLNNNTSMFINVNVMAVAGKVKDIQNIIDIFYEENVKFTINKIGLADFDLEREKKITRKHYNERKKYFNIKSNANSFKDRHTLTNARMNEYYTKEELEIIRKNQNLMEWQDTKVYYKSHVEEKNALGLLNDGLTNFLGWHCYAGVDSIYINHDGGIYRANCYAGGIIGNINDSNINWPDDAIVCPHNICSCNADIRLRKTKSKEYLNNITDS